MRSILMALALALVVVPAAMADKPEKSEKSEQAGTSSQGQKAFVAKLTGAGGAKGNVVVRLNAAKDTVCWSFSRLKLPSGKTAYVAHIHVKPAPGAVHIPLGGTPMSRRGCTTNASWNDAINSVIANPAGYYVNVHEEAGPLNVLLTGSLKKGAPAS